MPLMMSIITFCSLSYVFLSLILPMKYTFHVVKNRMFLIVFSPPLPVTELNFLCDGENQVPVKAILSVC